MLAAQVFNKEIQTILHDLGVIARHTGVCDHQVLIHLATHSEWRPVQDNVFLFTPLHEDKGRINPRSGGLALTDHIQGHDWWLGARSLTTGRRQVQLRHQTTLWPHLAARCANRDADYQIRANRSSSGRPATSHRSLPESRSWDRTATARIAGLSQKARTTAQSQDPPLQGKTRTQTSL